MLAVINFLTHTHTYIYMFFIYKYICTICQSEAGDGSKVEYRVWNPFRSKLAAAILGGIEDIHMVSLLYISFK